MKWFREHWFEIVAYTGIVVLILGVLAAVILGANQVGEKHRANEACVNVLRCIDQGIEREKCDELFPSCTKESP